MADRLRAIRTTLAYSLRADRMRAVTVVLLQVAAAANSTLTGLWVKMLVDGVAAGAVTPVAIGTIGLAAFVFVDVMVSAGEARVNLVLREKTVQLMDVELLGAVARSPGLAFHEQHEHLTQLELWQSESWQFGQAVPALVGLLFMVARLVFTGVLLGSISPVLLAFPLFGVPTILMSGKTSGLFLLGADGLRHPAAARSRSSTWPLARRQARRCGRTASRRRCSAVLEKPTMTFRRPTVPCSFAHGSSACRRGCCSSPATRWRSPM